MEGGCGKCQETNWCNQSICGVGKVGNMKRNKDIVISRVCSFRLEPQEMKKLSHDEMKYPSLVRSSRAMSCLSVPAFHIPLVMSEQGLYKQFGFASQLPVRLCHLGMLGGGQKTRSFLFPVCGLPVCSLFLGAWPQLHFLTKSGSCT